VRAIEAEILTNFQLDRDLRKRGTLWLGVLGDDNTVDALIAIMHKDPYLRRTAAEALRQLTKQPFRDSPREWYDWYAGYRESRRPVSVEAPPPIVPKGVVLPQVPPGFVPGSPSNIEEASPDASK